MHENLFIEIISGPMTGKTVRIQEGLQIGRSRGELKVEDPRISSLHAQVIKHTRGIFVLLDRQSSNKIIFNGEKVDKVALIPGVQFTLGDTRFRVSHKPLENAHPDLDITAATDQPLAPINDVAFLSQFKEFLNQDRHREISSQLNFFDVPLWLDFVEGPEVGRKVGLVYGPRSIGRESFDILISEPSAPPLAFSVAPSPLGLQHFDYKTRYPALVRLNGEGIESKCVDQRGTVQIGKTKINIYFSEER